MFACMMLPVSERRTTVAIHDDHSARPSRRDALRMLGIGAAGAGLGLTAGAGSAAGAARALRQAAGASQVTFPEGAIVRGVLEDLSPDVLAGRPADESDDVWSLCVVLYEMVSGEHPFTGAGADEVADRIRRQLVGRGARSATDSETQAPVAAFAASMLRAAQSARPATARAFAAALREMVGDGAP